MAEGFNQHPRGFDKLARPKALNAARIRSADDPFAPFGCGGWTTARRAIKGRNRRSARSAEGYRDGRIGKRGATRTNDHPTSLSTTFPCTSVRRKSRPWNR